MLEELRREQLTLEHSIAELDGEIEARQKERSALESKLQAIIAVYRAYDDGDGPHEHDGQGAELADYGAIEKLRSIRRPALTGKILSSLEYSGRRFSSAGEFCNHLGEPNYFSSEPNLKGRGDSADRQVFLWAKRNPSLARKVTVNMKTGESFSLEALTKSLWPKE